MRNVIILFVSFFLIINFTGCSKETDKDIASDKKENFKIAFLSNKEAEQRKFDIFLTDTSGINIRNLTKGRGDVRSYASPKFGPDQNYLFYTSEVDGKRFLNYIDLANDTVKTLTKLYAQNSKPIYSPILEKVFFVDRAGKTYSIYSIDFSGENRKRLIDDVFDVKEFDSDEVNRNIVFSARYGRSTSLFIYNIDEDNLSQLTDDKGDDEFPSFSKDGKRVLFSSSRNAEKDNDFDIYLVDINTQETQVIFDSRFYDTEPEFFPDNEWIAFLSNRRAMKYRDILIKEIDSDEGKNLTMSLGILHQNFSISPAGSFILFEFIQSVNSDIYLVDVETGKFKNISNDPAWDTSPTL